MTSPAAHHLTAVRPATSRSRVTNGRALFAQGDGRGPWARRFRDLIELHADDVGGASSLSESQLSLIRRAATIEVELEKLEGELANGGDVDLDSCGRNANSLRRILESLGLRRAKRDVTPDLATYLASKAKAAAP